MNRVIEGCMGLIDISGGKSGIPMSDPVGADFYSVQ